MNDRSELFTIGQLARRTGLPVRTIRFWSDLGVTPPTGRTAAGYRLYGLAAVARLELVQTLRELGLDLDTVRRVVCEQVSIVEVARTHALALDAEIRTLRLRRAVLGSVVQRGTTTEEMRIMHRLARLSAQERQRIIDQFVDEVFDGVEADAPGAGIAGAMRQLPAELPGDPTAEQVDAWIELAELVDEKGFRQRVRQMAVAGARGEETGPGEPAAVLEHAGAAVAAGVAPESAQGREILHRLVDPALPVAERAQLADRLETFTDRRVERYWQLMGILNGRPPFPSAVPAFEWFIAALRAPGQPT